VIQGDVLSEESRESTNDHQQERIILALLEQPTLEHPAQNAEKH